MMQFLSKQNDIENINEIINEKINEINKMKKILMIKHIYQN